MNNKVLKRNSSKFILMEDFDNEIKNIVNNEKFIKSGFDIFTLILIHQYDFLNIFNLSFIHQIINELIIFLRSINFYFYFINNPKNWKIGLTLKQINEIEFLKNIFQSSNYNNKKKIIINSILIELIRIKYDYNSFNYKKCIEYTLNFIDYK